MKGRIEDLSAAVAEFGGHALSLNLLGTYLRDSCHGDVNQRHELSLIDPATQGGSHAKGIIASYEAWFGNGPELGVLRLLGLFNRIARPEEIDFLRRNTRIAHLTEKINSLSGQEWNRILTRLRGSQLLASAREYESDALDAHPLVRAYFADEVCKKYPKAWQEGHRRLYEYNTEAAKEKPDTEEEMRPLFDAVFHGCHAGRHVKALKDVMQPRVLRWNERTRPRFYSTNTLGLWADTVTAIRHFFKKPWTKVLNGFDQRDEAFLFTAAGACLRALYRFPEAMEAMKEGLRVRLNLNEWIEASFALRMLNQIYIAIGRVKEAQDCGKESVEYADKGKKRYEDVEKGGAESADKEKTRNKIFEDCICARARYAESLHHGARYAEDLGKAKRQFEEALAMLRLSRVGQEGDLPDGFNEFEYCDLLITLGEYDLAKERARRMLNEEKRESKRGEYNPQPLWKGLSHLLLGKIEFIAACLRGRYKAESAHGNA